MKNTKVVHLRQIRDLLAEWDVVRQDILRGNVSGWMGALQRDGKETIYLGGVFHDSSEDRLRAVLKMSAARAQVEDPPLPTAANQ